MPNGAEFARAIEEAKAEAREMEKALRAAKSWLGQAEQLARASEMAGRTGNVILEANKFQQAKEALRTAAEHAKSAEKSAGIVANLGAGGQVPAAEVAHGAEERLAAQVRKAAGIVAPVPQPWTMIYKSGGQGVTRRVDAASIEEASAKVRALNPDAADIIGKPAAEIHARPAGVPATDWQRASVTPPAAGPSPSKGWILSDFGNPVLPISDFDASGEGVQAVIRKDSKSGTFSVEFQTIPSGEWPVHFEEPEGPFRTMDEAKLAAEHEAERAGYR